MNSHINIIDVTISNKLDDALVPKSKLEAFGARSDGYLNEFEFINDIPKSGLSQIDYLLSNGEKYSQRYFSNFIEVVFKGNHKKLYTNLNKIELRYDELVVVECDGGFDLGRVINFCDNTEKYKKDLSAEPHNFLPLIRRASKDDLRYFNRKIEDERNVVSKCREIVNLHKLDMKVTESYWQYDRQRLTIFFTAPQRIDFRELVKELAKNFKTRIELRQISSREEAKRLGSFIGPCGRELCCTTFLCNFAHVTLDHARVQHLSNNISKLSGNCGRLKCCIKYEYESYAVAAEKYPPIHSLVDTEDGIAKIAKIDIFKDIVTIYITESGTFRKITSDELNEYIKQGKVKYAETYHNKHHLDEELKFLEG
ncbi:MAG: hypothetical protein KGZ71_12805 [Desulfobulbaceae bacterium]|nr:hypothetical protein [Candidatus Kapabacteria bacterium]MBS4001350.1 hypothetical protein [Desulfobulbaceae bacterium]